jgi:hypothetical protein
LRARLAGVAYYLKFAHIQHFEDAPALKGKLREILERLTKVKSGFGDASNIEATFKRLSDEEAKEISQDIVGVAFDEMDRLAERS